jgi:hypothetical protein
MTVDRVDPGASRGASAAPLTERAAGIAQFEAVVTSGRRGCANAARFDLCIGKGDAHRPALGCGTDRPAPRCERRRARRP